MTVPPTSVAVAVVTVLGLLQSAEAADLTSAHAAMAEGDYESAFEAFRDLAHEGHAQAQYELAELYANGLGVRTDLDVALYWYRQAAQQEVAEAQNELALRYLLGRGVPQDYEQAAYWYRQLAEDGHAPAQHLLAGLYEDGSGVPQDLSQATFWYRRAAEQGHAGAQTKLGRMYRDGSGVPRDLVQAWAWFDLAARKGRDEAGRDRSEIAQRLNEEELAAAMALSRERGGRPVTATAPPETRQPPEAAPQMVTIEGGCFAMGSTLGEPGRHANEVRQSQCVDGFSIARYEVTRQEYAEFVRDTARESADGCQTHQDGVWQLQAGRSWQETGFPQGAKEPVVCVSRDDAVAYASWLSNRLGTLYRLPTEIEWEFAARAGATTTRPWGDDMEPACLWGNVGDRALLRSYPDWPWEIHRCDDGHVHTAPVGSYSANAFSIYDMVGNVWEWTCSSYDPEYRGAEGRCADNQSMGVVRGGSWSNSPVWVRSAARFPNPPSAKFDLVGFRLVRD